MASSPENMTEYCPRCGAQLECGQIGLCDSCQDDDQSDDAGEFGVDAYLTRATWEGPAAADDSLDGFISLAAARAYADSEEFADYYQVTVVALGKHAEYESGEPVYYRFDRADPVPPENAS